MTTEELFEKYFTENYPDYDSYDGSYTMGKLIANVNKDDVLEGFKAGIKAVLDELPEKTIYKISYDDAVESNNPNIIYGLGLQVGSNVIIDAIREKFRGLDYE